MILKFLSKPWKVEHTQTQFMIFLGFINIPKHLMRTGVIHVNDGRAQTPFINLLIIDYSKSININRDTLLLRR